MRKYSVIAFLGLCAMSVFWACGEGEYLNASDGDYIAIERYANVSANEIADVMGKCDGDEKCIEETMKKLQIVDEPDSTKQDSSKSSSSTKDDDSKDDGSSSSVESDTTAKDSTAQDSTASSSSGADSEDVSSASGEESSDSSDSEEGTSSASEKTETSSSSRGGRSSADGEEEESSGSETPASSDIPEPEEDPEVGLDVAGVCQSSITKVAINGFVTWTFVPKSGEGYRQNGMVEWSDNDATEETYSQSGKNLFSVKMQYSDVDPASKVYPNLTFAGVPISCEDAAATVTSVVLSSSSNAEIPESSATDQPGSGASVKSSSSRSGGGAVIFDDSSDSSEAASSSSGTSVASSSSATPTSSNATVNPPASGEDETLAKVAVTKETHEFAPGKYAVTCSGAGSLVCWSPSGTPFGFKFGDETCTATGGEGWGSCGSGSCVASETVLSTEQTVKCKADW